MAPFRGAGTLKKKVEDMVCREHHLVCPKVPGMWEGGKKLHD